MCCIWGDSTISLALPHGPWQPCSARAQHQTPKGQRTRRQMEKIPQVAAHSQLNSFGLDLTAGFSSLMKRSWVKPPFGSSAIKTLLSQGGTTSFSLLICSSPCSKNEINLVPVSFAQRRETTRETESAPPKHPTCLKGTGMNNAFLILRYAAHLSSLPFQGSRF